MSREPIAIIAAFEVAAIAIIGVIALQLGWTPEFTASVEGAATAFMAFVAALVIAVGTWGQRRVVDSPETVERKVDEALRTPVPEE